MYCEPMFDVMMMTVFLKSTVLPCPSVIRPSSSTCSKNVKHIVVRFFDFVEQHHRIRLAPHGFAELAAFFVTDISRRRADQPRDGVFLHVFAHVDADHGVLVVEQKFGERAGQFRFADTGRSEKNEGTDGPIWILQAGARAAHGVRDCLDRFFLADDALMQDALPS